MDTWTSLSVKQSTVEKLREQKPESLTWDAFLRRTVDEGLCITGEQDSTTVTDVSAIDLELADTDKDDLIERLGDSISTESGLTDAEKEALMEQLNQNYSAITETTNATHELLQKIEQL